MAERDKPWSVKELSDASGVDESYIRRLCVQGKLSAYKIGERTWAIPADVGQKWLDERRSKD